MFRDGFIKAKAHLQFNLPRDMKDKIGFYRCISSKMKTREKCEPNAERVRAWSHPCLLVKLAFSNAMSLRPEGKSK